MARLHEELIAELSRLGEQLDAVAAAGARRERIAWCACTAFVASALTVLTVVLASIS
jgi:hypothetical protein